METSQVKQFAKRVEQTSVENLDLDHVELVLLDQIDEIADGLALDNDPQALFARLEGCVHILNVLPYPMPYLRAAPIYARLHDLQTTIEDRL